MFQKIALLIFALNINSSFSKDLNKNQTRIKFIKKDYKRNIILPNISLDKLTNEQAISKKLKNQRDMYLYQLRNQASRSSLDQTSANITYLEILKDSQEMQSREISSAITDKDQKSNFHYKGHFQFRTESAKNRQGFLDSNQSEQSFFRLRTNFTFIPNNNLKFNVTPQFTKGFGADVPGTTTTSGSTNHSEVFFFEANIDYKLFEGIEAKLGRQELAYGDHLIIGSLPWANTGRSFDALKLKHSYSLGWFDLVYSKISDNCKDESLTCTGAESTALTSGDDTDLLIAYNSITINESLKNLDTYIIHQDNDSSASSTESNTFGFRAQGSLSNFFYRTENAFQQGANLGDKAYQYNIEVGSKFYKYSASIEYAVAGEDYQQLYPTAHKFLGIADVLGRKNIEQYAFHFKGAINPWLSFQADYHIFARNNNEQGAYSLTTAKNLGTLGQANEIGKEIDLVLNFKTTENIKAQLGAAFFEPDQYMKDQGLDETVTFLYAQVNANF